MTAPTRGRSRRTAGSMASVGLVSVAMVVLLLGSACTAPGSGDGPAASAADPSIAAPTTGSMEDGARRPPPPEFDLDLTGLDLSEVALALDAAGEEAAQPPLMDEDGLGDERDNGGDLDEAAANLDDLIDVPLRLDPGSALACAAFELGRDAALDGDVGFGVELADRVTTNGETIADSTISEVALRLADAAVLDQAEAERGLDRCLTLGYETAS